MIARVNVLGVSVSAVDLGIVLAEIDRWIAERRRDYVCVTGSHGVIESQRDPELKAIHNRAGLVVPDGMPLVWMSHIHRHRYVSQVCGRELMVALCAHSVPRGYRHFFYGGAPGVAELLSRKLCDRLPGLRVAGTLTPPFRTLTREEDEGVDDRINDAEPDIVWVGLSTPKQERWMAAHRDALSAPVMLGVGAAFDFNSELKKAPPAWIQRNGLEWAFRLSNEPRRLWRRYAYVVPAFIALNLAQLLHLREFPLESPAEGRERH